MITNIDRAADIIRKRMDNACAEPAYSDCNDDHDVEAACDLKRAGYLMPDLPEPDDPTVPEWECPDRETVAVSIGRFTGDIRIWGDTSGYTPSQARWVAYALLAASDHAERDQK